MLSTTHSTPTSSSKPKKASTVAREGFFLEAAKEIRRQFPDLVLFITGGFRSARGIEDALATSACDAICLGRPAVRYPNLPRWVGGIAEGSGGDARFDVEAAPSPGWIATKIKSAGSGAESVRVSVSISNDQAPVALHSSRFVC
jgi:tRNA-dihydrouridine synthase